MEKFIVVCVLFWYTARTEEGNVGRGWVDDPESENSLLISKSSVAMPSATLPVRTLASKLMSVISLRRQFSIHPGQLSQVPDGWASVTRIRVGGRSTVEPHCGWLVGRRSVSWPADALCRLSARENSKSNHIDEGF